jgi:hypothetical protein
MALACRLPHCRAGASSASNKAMMLMTTKSSIKVNPVRRPHQGRWCQQISLPSNGIKPFRLSIGGLLRTKEFKIQNVKIKTV